MKTKQQLESEYVEIRNQIKQQMTIIKQYAESIQAAREKLKSLASSLEAIQTEYKQSGFAEQQLEGESNE